MIKALSRSLIMIPGSSPVCCVGFEQQERVLTGHAGQFVCFAGGCPAVACRAFWAIVKVWLHLHPVAS